MGKVKIEEAVKELHRMSKRMKRVARLLSELSNIDDRFEKKSDEMMTASLIAEEWGDSIKDEFIKDDLLVRNSNLVRSE